MSIELLYLLLTVIPNLSEVINNFIPLLIPLLLGFIAFYVISKYNGEKELNKIALRGTKISFIVFLSLLTLSIFIPKEEQIAYIIGGSIVTNAEGIEELPDNLVTFANEFLKEHTEEAQKDDQ